MEELMMTGKKSGSSPEPWGKNVLVEFEDGIAWVTMNRPEKRNAINLELAKEMVGVVDVVVKLVTVGMAGGVVSMESSPVLISTL